MDGQFIINDRGSVVPIQHKPTALSPFSEAPPPTLCTPNDPFGRGADSVQFKPSSPYSRSELDMRAAQEKSAAAFGEAILSPVLKAAEWSPPGLAFEIGTAAKDIVETLYQAGTEGLAAKQIVSIASKVAADAIAKKLKLQEASRNQIQNAIQDGVGVIIDTIQKSGGGSIKLPKEPGDSIFAQRQLNGWSKEQDDIQSTIDRQEHEERTGTAIA